LTHSNGFQAGERYDCLKVGIQVRADIKQAGRRCRLSQGVRRSIAVIRVQVELLSSAQEVRSFQPRLLIAFNLDQMLELFDVCRSAKDCGAEVAVYALHHPSQACELI